MKFSGFRALNIAYTGTELNGRLLMLTTVTTETSDKILKYNSITADKIRVVRVISEKL